MQDYRCQKFDDYVHDAQFDNTYSKTPQYGVFEWVCGDGQRVTCPSLDCADDCRILRGGFSNSSGSMGDGDAGVLSIRNVTFLKDYHSPIEANEYNFDFIFAFYQDDTLVTASLINGYTVNQTRLSLMKATVVNKYLDDTPHFNAGDRIPTLLSLSGHFTLNEASTVNSIAVYFPTSLTSSFFKEEENRIGCSTQ